MSTSETAYASRWKDVDYRQEFTPARLDRDAHRHHVGGQWDRMGRLQRQFLVGRGLRPHHTLLDVGCGALRAGVHLVEYLETDRYHGLDINQTLLDAGYDRELPLRLRPKLPRDHLRATDRFDADFGVTFDYAIAQSVFTHVSLNHIRLCLYRVAQVMAPGGRLFATFFEVADNHDLDAVRPGRRGLWTERNPYFYYRSDLEWAASFAPWHVRYIGDWGHPSGQRMVEFRRARRSWPAPVQRRVAPAVRRFHL